MSDMKEYIDNQIQWLEKVTSAKIEAERRVNEAELKAVRQAVEKVEIKNLEDRGKRITSFGEL